MGGRLTESESCETGLGGAVAECARWGGGADGDLCICVSLGGWTIGAKGVDEMRDGLGGMGVETLIGRCW